MKKSAGKPASKLESRAKKVHVVEYQGSHLYIVWDPEINQIRETSGVSIKEEFSPPQNKPYKAAATSEDLPTEDTSDIAPRDEFYQPAKGFAILKSTESSLP